MEAEAPTCSDVKATSLGTDDIPFSFTSGNILKRASSMAYMLEIAPPRGQTGVQWVSPYGVTFQAAAAKPQGKGNDAGTVSRL